MAFLKLHPLDDQGYMANRPSTEAKFTRLSNLITLDGKLRTRPGIIPVGPDAYDMDGLNLEWGIPILIGEVLNPGPNVTDRVGTDRATETLRPDGDSEVVAGWSGGYTDIDEVVPDGAAYVESSTASSMEVYTFGNLSTSYDNIVGIVIRGRARQNQEGGKALLNVYFSSTDLISAETIYAESWALAETEADYWQNFAIPLAVHPSTNQAFTTATVNAFSVGLEHGGGGTASETIEYLPAAGDGSDTEWVQYQSTVTDATDTGGSSASYTDFDGRLLDAIDASDQFAWPSWSDVRAGIPIGNEVAQAFTVGNLSHTYASITSATLRLWIGSSSIHPTGRVQIYFKTGGTEYLVNSTNIENPGPPTKGQAIEVEMTTDPSTDVAWLQAAINGSEWVVKRVVGGARPVLMGVDLKVVGNLATTPTLQVDNLAIDVYTIDDAIPDRYLVSTKNYLLLKGDDDAFTNIQGSATTTGIGAVPHDVAVLYGQAYMVDGTTTRRYPESITSAAIWEDLTDNDGTGAAKISGRTVAAFADRILYGWVTDAGNVTPERVAYSKEFDGGTHNDASAGDFDILITPGGVLCLEPLNDDLCACYKEVGIYTLRRTGFSFAPIVPDPIDMETKLIAEATVRNVVGPAGDPVQYFLGKNARGYNVFQFDGMSVQPVGDGIQPFLRDNTNPATLSNSFAEIDPVGGFYWLFVPEGSQLFPEQAWILNINTGNWTRAESPGPSL